MSVLGRLRGYTEVSLLYERKAMQVITEEEYPTLSLEERDRRWTATKVLLERLGLEALLVFGMRSREQWEHYLANESNNGIVLFPLTSEPRYLVFNASRAFPREEIDNVMRNSPWISDVRWGDYALHIVEFLRERQLANKRIGVVGLRSQGPAEEDGIIPQRLWEKIQSELPLCEFQDISREYALLMLSKSTEELALVRKGAAIGEAACRAMLNCCKSGVMETHIYSEILHSIHSQGATTVPPHLLFSVGKEHMGHAPPHWFFPRSAPRSVENGDIVIAEIFSVYGGIETQQQMTVCVGEVSRTVRQLAKVARLSYEAGLNTLSPGVTFGEVYRSMQAPILEEGCWHLGPVVHSMGPIVLTSAMLAGAIDWSSMRWKYNDIESVAGTGDDVVIQEGMVFELEPSPARGKERVTVGGTIVVTASGVEELNEISTRVHFT